MSSQGVFCKNCGTKLEPHQRPCPACGCTNVLYEEELSETIIVREGCKVRHKRKGFRKFIAEVINDWFPSRNPKLSEGVEKLRIIDKERDMYDEVVKDARTGETIHETHEPLSQHKHFSSSD